MPKKPLVHIVDDDESVRSSLDFLLSTAGYRVERWNDGESFLKAARKTEAGCVLLDIRMPGIDGLEVQRRMPEAGLDYPVIMLTGHGDVSLAVKAMQAGAVDFMPKPFDRESLLNSIDAAFQRIEDQRFKALQAVWAKTQINKLTERERQVLDGLACGYPNKTIAHDLNISTRTVEVFRANLMLKLQVHSFADALRIAFAAGLGSEEKWRSAYCVGANRH